MQMIISVCQLMKRGVTGFITPGPSRGVKLQADLLTPYRVPLIAPTATGTQYTVLLNVLLPYVLVHCTTSTCATSTCTILVHCITSTCTILVHCTTVTCTVNTRSGVNSVPRPWGGGGGVVFDQINEIVNKINLKKFERQYNI